MRKFLILCFVAVSTMVYSQKELAWFDTGIKIMYGSSYVINNSAINSSNLNYDLGLNGALSIGGKFGVNRGYNGLAVELMYATNAQQYEYLASSTIPEIKWKSLDLYLLFRNAANLGWFEIGPKIGFMRSVERTDELGSITEMPNFNDKAISGVLGFGVNVIGTDGSFSGQIGLRVEYGFTDLVGADPTTTSEPYPFDPSIQAETYNKSIPIYAGLVFEMNWGLGYYGIAQCGARAKFFSI